MNKKPTLLILAAGSSTRFGKLKQTAKIGQRNETIMDYSIYDAVRAGFGKIVFVIRESFYETFMNEIVAKWEGVIEIDYAFQELDTFVSGVIRVREKPWGTGHAMLCAKEKIDTDFCVINADDFYGSASFELMAQFLRNESNEKECAMVAFEMKSTLSENGAVSRGVCSVSDNGYLTSVLENSGIRFSTEKKSIVSDTDEGEVILDGETLVSMNFWGFPSSVFPIVQELFDQFIASEPLNSKEFFLPSIVQHMIGEDTHRIKVMKSVDKWFGVTFSEDQQTVMDEIQNRLNKGIYPHEPWKESLIQL